MEESAREKKKMTNIQQLQLIYLLCDPFLTYDEAVRMIQLPRGAEEEAMTPSLSPTRPPSPRVRKTA